MLGDIPWTEETSPISFEKDFRQIWEERLAQFDDVVSCYNREERLFDNVTTCGNLYAICKKLENLLKSSGFSKNQQRDNRGTKSVPLEMRDNDLIKSETTAATTPRHHSDANDSETKISIALTETSAPFDLAPKMDEVLPDDDDDELLPGSTDVFTSFQKTDSSPQIEENDSGFLPPSTRSTKALKNGATKLSRQNNSGNLLLRNPLSKSSSVSQIATVQTKGITDIFPNIAELFPAVQSLLRNMQRVG